MSVCIRRWFTVCIENLIWSTRRKGKRRTWWETNSRISRHDRLYHRWSTHTNLYFISFILFYRSRGHCDRCKVRDLSVHTDHRRQNQSHLNLIKVVVSFKITCLDGIDKEIDRPRLVSTCSPPSSGGNNKLRLLKFWPSSWSQMGQGITTTIVTKCQTIIDPVH